MIPGYCWFPRTFRRQVPIKHTTISISISLLKITFSVYFFPTQKKKLISTPSTCAQRMSYPSQPPPWNHPRSAEWSAVPVRYPPCPGFRSYLGAGFCKMAGGRANGCPDIGYFIVISKYVGGYYYP